MEGTIGDLAKQRWYLDVDCDANTFTIQRKDPVIKGAMVGPLATVPIGMTEEDDDATPLACLDADDGRNAIAILLLPQIAKLLTWIAEEEDKLSPSHFDVEAKAFHKELRARVQWIIRSVNERDRTFDDGATMCLQAFDDGRSNK